MCKLKRLRNSVIHTSPLTGSFSGRGYRRCFAILPPGVNYYPLRGDPGLYLAVLSGKEIGRYTSLDQALKKLRKAYAKAGPWKEDELHD